MNPFILIAGPCAIEDRDTSFAIATFLKELCKKLNIHFIFKASYRKANRSRLDSFTGIGDEQALDILRDIKKQLKVDVLTDVHESQDVQQVAEIVDYIQIPAFLCRQTALLLAAAKTNKTIHIKKGQFLSPEAMAFPIEKVRSTGNQKIMICERGTSFGYSDLIVDATAIYRLKKHGVPVIMDCTHAVQKPNQASGITGGDPEWIEAVALSAIANGVDGFFIETHPQPQTAMSDPHTMLQMDKIKSILVKALKIKNALEDAKEY